MNDNQGAQLFERLQKQLRKINERLGVLEQHVGIRPQATPKPRPAKMQEKEVPLFDWQRFEWNIGAYILQIIGVVVFLFGMGFLLKYSIELGWLGPVVRVVLGLVAATSLFGVSHYLRKEYHLWSMAGSAGAVVLYYLSVSAAYSLYLLIPLYIAFLGFICITLLSVYFAIIYNSIVFASFSLVGAFLTPWFLEISSYNSIGLAVYLALIAFGFTILGIRKNWQSLLLISQGFLIGYYLFTSLSTLLFPASFCFLIALYIILITVPCLYATKKGYRSSLAEALQVIVAYIWLILPFKNNVIKPLLTSLGITTNFISPFAITAVLFSILALVHLGILYRRNKLNTAMLRALFIVTVSCFVEAIFAQWSGYDRIIALQLFGLVIVVISWLVKQPLMRIASYIIWLFSLLSFILSVSLGGYKTDNVLFNYITLTMLVLCSVYGVARAIIRRENMFITEREKIVAPKAFELATAFLVYAWGRALIVLQFDKVILSFVASLRYTNLTNVLLTIYSSLYALLMISIGFYKRTNWLRYFGLGLVCVTLVKLLSLITQMPDTLYRIIAFLLVGILIIVVSLVYQRMSKRVLNI